MVCVVTCWTAAIGGKQRFDKAECSREFVRFNIPVPTATLEKLTKDLTIFFKLSAPYIRTDNSYRHMHTGYFLTLVQRCPI